MYISRLQLKGFKSFGNSQELVLSGGFMAIVGPNGSGKSNLLDALRWALGDSAASHLRIAKQSDLLFQGSVSLPAAKEGEVSVQLKDDLQLCTIRRRITAEGSALLADGVRVTHLQLDEIKRRFHLEGDRFAFIGQGEVAEVIQQRPAARRVQLEALFGIDVYRKRRSEATERLKNAQVEYQRLRTFSAELRSRRDEIAPMVVKAAQAREQLDALELLRRSLYFVRRRRLEALLIEISVSIKGLLETRRAQACWLDAWTKKFTQINDIAALAYSDIKATEQEIASCQSFFNEHARHAFTAGTALYEAKKSLAAIGEQRGELALAEEANQKELLAQRSEKALISEELDAASSKLAELELRYKEEEIKRKAKKAAFDDLLHQKGALEAQIESSKAYLQSLGARYLNTKKSLKSKEEQIAQAAKELESAKLEVLKARDAGEIAASVHAKSYTECQALAARIQTLRREASALSAQIDRMTETLELHSYPAPVMQLLSAARLGRLEAAPVAVIDAFKCPAQYAEALDAYLGGRQFWLLVETMDEAGRCIEMLKARQAGRATILPLDRVKPRNPDRRTAYMGAVGFVLDLIKCEAKWQPALSHLMGDVLIVATYGDGKAIIRQGFRSPVVSLEGDVFQTTGAISGGKNQKSAQALELKAKIENEKIKLDALEAKLRNIGKELEIEEKAEREAAIKRDEQSALLKEVNKKEDDASERLEALKGQKAREENLIGELSALLAKEGKARQSAARELAAIAKNLKGGDEQEGERTVEDKELDTASAHMQLLEEKLKSSSALLYRMEHEEQNINQRKESTAQDTHKNEERKRGALRQLENIGVNWLEIYNKFINLKEKLEKEREKIDETDIKIQKIRTKKELAQGKLKGTEEGTSKAVQEKTAANKELDELIGTWEEQYQYDESAHIEEEPDELRRRVREIERAVKALGELDMGVLSEERSLKDRLAFLGEQLDDVRQSMAELEKLIQDADRQASTVFNKALQEIDEKFNHLFQRLFGGGEAHLEIVDTFNNNLNKLKDGDDANNASDTSGEGGENINSGPAWDAGVEVIARPPGKRPQGITQLSGGEQSLSAIALLFASMEVAGCPLAVLDEVDAALDEVNLRRFADLVKEYAKSRQILAMTHRRVTMERADVLFGVTLSEPGLSQVVGVRLEDWT